MENQTSTTCWALTTKVVLLIAGLMAVTWLISGSHKQVQSQTVLASVTR